MGICLFWQPAIELITVLILFCFLTWQINSVLFCSVVMTSEYDMTLVCLCVSINSDDVIISSADTGVTRQTSH